jgi:hypothetical protein
MTDLDDSRCTCAACTFMPMSVSTSTAPSATSTAPSATGVDATPMSVRPTEAATLR